MKNYSIEIKWALIFSAAALVWMFIEKSVGLHDVMIDKHPIYTNLFGIVAIVLYVLALRDKKNNFFDGKMDWRQGFISGIILTAMITLLSPVCQYITNTFISPDYFTNAINYADEHKLMKREDAVMYFNLKSYIMQGIFGSLSMGVVTAAIVAYFMKSK
ncbi:DUF4199 domain-containing protein [Flavobacterium sp.]|uniref:DUF4199 domain-containing protein n=1 Tax=Flavobacterium sp. TaxID=239 RepID=UPI0028BE8295|nr:DUF4199 domain-containing protein [Flavobacterium sp.]